MFHFKQFSVDQTGCAMKINTDGVLLGALAGGDKPSNILDIGTGTGVIALMLAQRFPTAQIDAVEIDEAAANTADNNFKNSAFKDGLVLYATDFKTFFDERTEKKYDLIVSNPPFYINSLQSPGAKKNQAKHAGEGFFENLISEMSLHITDVGNCWLILPLDTAEMVKGLAMQYRLYAKKIIAVRSFKDDLPHREVVVLGLAETTTEITTLTIYEEFKTYSEMYKQLLQPYFLAF
jgi:tRNA1Val (adenine37-N6)-methyltransferase